MNSKGSGDGGRVHAALSTLPKLPGAMLKTDPRCYGFALPTGSRPGRISKLHPIKVLSAGQAHCRQVEEMGFVFGQDLSCSKGLSRARSEAILTSRRAGQIKVRSRPECIPQQRQWRDRY